MLANPETFESKVEAGTTQSAKDLSSLKTKAEFINPRVLYSNLSVCFVD